MCKNINTCVYINAYITNILVCIDIYIHIRITHTYIDLCAAQVQFAAGHSQKSQPIYTYICIYIYINIYSCSQIYVYAYICIYHTDAVCDRALSESHHTLVCACECWCVCA